MDEQSIKSVLDSEVGRSLREWLQTQVETLKSIDNLEDTTVVEVKAQKKAYKKLKEIFSEIMTFSEPTKVKDSRDSYEVL